MSATMSSIMTAKERYVTAAIAAHVTGVDARTIRRWAARGSIPARRTPRGQLFDLDAVRRYAGFTDIDDYGEGAIADNAGISQACAANECEPVHDIREVASMVSANESALVSLVKEQQQQLLELAGRVGFYQARIQELERRILELEAPKETSAEISNHPTPTENAADSDSEKLPSRPWWRFWRWHHPDDHGS